MNLEEQNKLLNPTFAAQLTKIIGAFGYFVLAVAVSAVSIYFKASPWAIAAVFAAYYFYHSFSSAIAMIILHQRILRLEGVKVDDVLYKEPNKDAR